MSAVRQVASPEALDGGEIPGNIHGALEELDVPAYAVDRFGVIRWINGAAHKLVGDIRGRQQSSLVVPEQGPANDAVLLVEEDRPVHLAGEADAANVGRLQVRLGNDLADRCHDGLPPIVRVLLDSTK